MPQEMSPVGLPKKKLKGQNIDPKGGSSPIKQELSSGFWLTKGVVHSTIFSSQKSR